MQVLYESDLQSAMITDIGTTVAVHWPTVQPCLSLFTSGRASALFEWACMFPTVIVQE